MSKRILSAAITLAVLLFDRTSVAAIEQEVPLNDCDKYAANGFDDQRKAPGTRLDRIDPAVALPACIDARSRYPDATRFIYQLARVYGRTKDYDKAIELFQKAADANYVASWLSLGTFYHAGLGVQRDDSKASEFFRKAAEQGNAAGQYNLGVMFETGKGVAQNYSEAVKWYQLAAAQNNANAQLNLGTMYQNGRGVAQNYSEAVKWYQLAAKQGSAATQIQLGYMFAIGQGVAQNYSEAVKWYQLAAAQNNANAQSNLGTMYENGKGVAQNYSEAVKWYQLAAAQNNANGQFNLGTMYDNGHGVPKNSSEAIKWYRLAGDQGLATAQHQLGFIYDRGLIVAQDNREAVKWYRLAADQGLASAQYNLGLMYWAGRGVPQDFVRAHFWFNVAAAQGQANASGLRDKLSIRMSAQQIEQAQELARKCVSANYKQCGGEAQISGLQPPPPRSQTIRDAKASSSGTGFFVSNDGFLVTNDHVVATCENINAIDDAGQKFAAKVVQTSKPQDIALLKADAKRSLVASFRLSSKIVQGEPIFVYGYPLAGLLASSGNVSTGVITALAGLKDDTGQMQISAPVQQGNSGAPLVDIKGLVIGVVVSKLNAAAIARITSDIPQNVNFAIKASAVTNLLDANSVKYRNDGLWRDLSTETITQQMKEYTVKIECD